MKITHIYTILLSLLIVACGTSVNKGETLIKEMELDFHGAAHENDQLSFLIDKSVGLSVHFSKGTFEDNTYTITAEEYEVDKQPVIIKLSSEAEGTYEFSMKLNSATEALEVVYTIDEALIIKNLEVREKWKQYIIPAVLLLGILIVIFVLIMSKRREKLRPKFDSGYIQISYPNEEQIDIERKHKIDIAKFLQYADVKCIVYCTSITDEDGFSEKKPCIEVDEERQLFINNKPTQSNIQELAFGDTIIVKNAPDTMIIKLTINE